MKIKFFYFDISKYIKNRKLNDTRIIRSYDLLAAAETVKLAYCQYLLSTLNCDFEENTFGACDQVLNEVCRIENGEIENYFFEGGELLHYVSRDSVVFEHAIFGVCTHWPLWSCPLSHYKIGLQAVRDFYALPESLNSEVVVELPKSDMAQITLFPPKLSENKSIFGESTID